MTEHLASVFGTAVGLLPTSQTRSLELFTEITDYDESACDAWVGRIRCGDTDRVTMFRAWYSRNNFGQLASAAEMSIRPFDGVYLLALVRRFVTTCCSRSASPETAGSSTSRMASDSGSSTASE